MKTLSDAAALLSDPSSFVGPETYKVAGECVRAEEIAEKLHDAGFKVKVKRSGTGNGSHTGWIGGCSVQAIEISGRWIAA